MWGCFWGELPQFWCPSPFASLHCLQLTLSHLHARPQSAPLCFPTTRHHCSHRELPKTFLPPFFLSFFSFSFSFCPFAFHFPIPFSLRPSPPAKPRRQNGRQAAILWEPAVAAGSSTFPFCLLLLGLHGAERTLRGSAFPSGKSCPCPAHFGTELSAAAIQRLKAAPALNGATLLLHGFLPPSSSISFSSP